MQVPRRYSTQWLMGAVAVVALVFGAAIELRTRGERDRAAAAEADNRHRAAWHREQAEVCDQAIAKGQSYGVKQRNFARRRSAEKAGLTDSESFGSWDAERSYHQYRAEIFENEAATFAEKRQAAQRRLLLPF